MIENRLIKFKRDTQFRNDLFTPESFAHPAKLDSQLLIWIVEKYTKQGETILDPMIGSGTAMLACMLGRNVIGVELEQKFVDMAKANWEKVRQRPQLGYPMGTCQILQGDARNLEGVMVDKCIFSPPFAGMNQMARDNIDPTADKNGRGNIGRQYADNPDNLGNLPYGSIDSVITSPPYEGIEARDRSKELRWDEEREKKFSGGSVKLSKGYSPNEMQAGVYSTNVSNIGNLKSISYLEAMAQVYRQCHKVLKPGGLMILITKNFIREQKEVRLDSDTIKLCEQAGFTFQERWYRELPAQSFWRIIYKQKYPDAPEL